MGVTDADGNLVYGGYFADPVVVSPIYKARNTLVEEATVLRGIAAPVPFKLTIPPPSYFLSDMVPTPPTNAYDSRWDFVDDVVEVERELIAEAVAAGVTWIQFDAAVYSMVADPHQGPRILELNGCSFDDLVQRALEVDRRVVAGFDGVTIGVHLCRGNMIEGAGSGSIEPVAERMFNELPYDRFLVEWDDVTKHGDYSPLRFLPAGKVAVLGLVSTKTPMLEDEDEIIRRIDAASRYAAHDRLALSPQCGFASIPQDRHVETEERQWRKLELVGRISDRVWGRS